MMRFVYKLESECSRAELNTWRRQRVAAATLIGAAAAAAVLCVLGMLTQLPTWGVFAAVCALCAAITGAMTRFFIVIPSPVLQQAMRDIRDAGGANPGERMIGVWV